MMIKKAHDNSRTDNDNDENTENILTDEYRDDGNDAIYLNRTNRWNII